MRRCIAAVTFVVVLAAAAALLAPSAGADGLMITYQGQDPPKGLNGWNTTAVTLTWQCSDGATPWTVTQTLTNEGENQTATGTCTDSVGDSVSNTVRDIDIDMTPPQLFCVPSTGPANDNGQRSVPDQNDSGYYTIGSNDATSGPNLFYLYDSASSFVAGPFYPMATIIKVTSSPGTTPNMKPGSGNVSYRITINGSAILSGPDFAGNVDTGTCPFF